MSLEKAKLYNKIYELKKEGEQAKKEHDVVFNNMLVARNNLKAALDEWNKLIESEKNDR